MIKEKLKKTLDLLISGDSWAQDKATGRKTKIGSCIKWKNGEMLQLYKSTSNNDYQISKKTDTTYEQITLTEDDMLNLIEFIYDAVNDSIGGDDNDIS